MQLSYLLQDHYLLPAQAEQTIRQLVTDSRKIQPGDVFIALKGAHVDGTQYIQQAITQGAKAILIDASANVPLIYQNNIPIIPIHHLPQALGAIAARYYDYPAKKLQIFGVTGTNGKTSCTYFLAQMLNELGVRCGIIGTLGCGFYGDIQETGFTTPDAITLQSILHRFIEQGAAAIAMEVSSHSIHQGRINGIDFDTVVFTNLTQDHLDYHGTMENYAAEKRRLLADFPSKYVVINADDAYGAKWIEELSSKRQVFPYSIKSNASHVDLSLRGLKADIKTKWGEAKLSLPVIGAFNLSNALAVLTILCLQDFPLAVIAKKMQHLRAVPGRMETISIAQAPLVVVDYSHTPDSLEKALATLRSLTQGKLICVFGCGGDRDQGKRPKMGAIVDQYADIAIITNDNPRHEDPSAIAQAILGGFTKLQLGENLQVELDRSKAIKKSIQLATVNDCILIAGKGAERYQQVGDEKLPFNDVEQALSLLKVSGDV